MISSTKQLKGRRLDTETAAQKLPKNWVRPGTCKDPASIIKTQKELFAKRRQEKEPDLTYDLDGDGAVSQKDFFLAKQFDADKDGKLNDKELETAKKALKEGYSNKFLFGLEASANRLSYNSLLPGFDYEKRH